MRAVIWAIAVFAFAAPVPHSRTGELSYGRVVRAIDAQLAERAANEELEISLTSIRRGTAVASALEQSHYVERRGDAYRFTPAARAQSKPCEAMRTACRVFAFGTSAREGRPLFATLYSHGTTFNEPLWTYWFTYAVKPTTPFAARAAREGLVDTISAPDARCPAVWRPRLGLLANASVGPDLPLRIEIKSRLFLHGAIAVSKNTSTLVCDYAAMKYEIDQTH